MQFPLSKDTTSAPRALSTRPGSRYIPVLVFILMFLLNLSTGTGPAGDQLDPSWTTVLSWASTHGQRFGADIVFTYGPLGFLIPRTSYLPDAYPVYLLGNALLALIVAWPLAALSLYLPYRWQATLLVLCTIWAPWIASDPSWMIYFAASAVLLGIAPTKGGIKMTHVILLGLGTSFVALVKFSMFPLALIWMVMMTASLLFMRQVSRALALPTSQIVGLVLFWTLSGQSLGDLADFIGTAFEVARGYSGAMAIYPPSRISAIGILLMLLTGGWLIAQMWHLYRKVSVICTLAVLGLTLFLAWKAGFTRGDAHTNMTMPVISFVSLLGLVTVTNSDGRWARASTKANVIRLGITVLLALVAIRPSVNLSPWVDTANRTISNTGELSNYDALTMRKLGEWNAARKIHAMPETLKYVGNQPVDLISYSQGVLFLNDLNYKPRPIFQSYSAYTPQLLRMNELNLHSANAPVWTLLQLATIDNRYPTLDDGLLLTQILSSHELVLEERGYLLMKRPATLDSIPEPVADKEGQMGTWIDVPSTTKGQLITAILDIELGVKGKLHQLLLRGSNANIEVETTAGTVEKYRVVTEMTKTPFILSPLPRTNHDIVEVLSGDVRKRRIKRFRLVPERALDKWLIKAGFRYGLATIPHKVLPPTRKEEFSGTRSAGFTQAPSFMSDGIELMKERDMLIMAAHAPSIIKFDVPAGHYSIKGQFGIRMDALSQPICLSSETDGIEMDVLLTVQGDEDNKRLLFKRAINPFKVGNDRGPIPFLIESLNLSKPGQLEIHINAGPNGSKNTACDWGYVRGIDISQLG